MRDFVDGTAYNNEQGNRARKLFAAVVLAALDDAIADDKKYGNGPEQIARWARSRDGREVLSCAGIDPNERCGRWPDGIRGPRCADLCRAVARRKRTSQRGAGRSCLIYRPASLGQKTCQKSAPGGARFFLLGMAVSWSIRPLVGLFSAGKIRHG